MIPETSAADPESLLPLAAAGATGSLFVATISVEAGSGGCQTTP